MAYIFLGDYMKYVKEYGLLFAKFLGFLLGGSIIMSILYYFLFSSRFVQILSIVYLTVVFFVFGFKAGHQTEAKGFLAGLKVGSLFLILLIIFNLFFSKGHFTFMNFLYYLILLFASLFGAMLGINTKKE